MEENNPSQTEIKEIFRDTYLFYTNLKDNSNPDWDEVLQDARNLEDKYPCRLCLTMLVELISCIEAEVMERNK